MEREIAFAERRESMESLTADQQKEAAEMGGGEKHWDRWITTCGRWVIKFGNPWGGDEEQFWEGDFQRFLISRTRIRRKQERNGERKRTSRIRMTLVLCGSLASVHSHKLASSSRFMSNVIAPLFFWLKCASTVLRACCQLLSLSLH